MEEMNNQTASPIPSKSSKSLALDGWTYLFEIYFAINFKESLMLLASNTMCSIELYNEIEWNLPFQILESIGTLGSYGNRMLMNVLSSSCAVESWGEVMLGWFPELHCEYELGARFTYVGLMFIWFSVAIPRQVTFSWVVS